MSIKEEKTVKSLRRARVFHRYLGLGLAGLLIISSLTGILLAWKKNVDTLQPPSQKGSTTELADWKPIHELADIAQEALTQHLGKSIPINRLDVRPSKGMVKVLFKEGNWEVQVDGNTGKVLSTAKRHADWIEQLHDGSIITDNFKLVIMNILGFGLLFLIGYGIWLWYGPKVLRRRKRAKKENAR